MSILSKVAGLGIGEIASGLGDLAKDIRAAVTGELSQEDKARVERKLLDLQGIAQETGARLFEVQGDIVKAEAQGESWLQRNWRPILMMSIVAIVVNNYLLVPYGQIFFPGSVKVLELPPALWELMKIGVGGYVVGRTGEKMIREWKVK
ncbi:Holin of 3TMs, for gene-transfer release [Desulfatibacillum alkenivorans DSM 16219]|jgi:hypothetical protein|uniref:Holin of 3TMs, for gene-transfer release n=1 Tax=Desulfatibacillum alkenivorans DSM 16219 TaxID=1121393 RepID=A0A1M6Z3L9_9BACT|nr:3TM-type holin [Desulfatibacillum alkenivorans]SHL25114.1 Holin of 3TMs, for gene-transfer release [Desulfatibacillum alkenivorans DSM 16219]